MTQVEAAHFSQGELPARKAASATLPSVENGVLQSQFGQHTTVSFIRGQGKGREIRVPARHSTCASHVFPDNTLQGQYH